MVETEGLGVLHHVRIRGYARQSKEISISFFFPSLCTFPNSSVNILEHNERRLRVYVAATSVNFLSTVAEFIDP